MIVGSAAGALIGLQFVVLTLIAERPPQGDPEMAGAAFATPTIVHFSAVLLVAAVLRMPWHSITALAVTWGLGGLFGIVYSAIVAWRLDHQSGYKPDREDWIYHVIVPAVGYAAMAGSAVTSASYENDSLFALGAAVLLLLFTGIHNAWDSIAYHVFVTRAQKVKGKI